MSALEGAVITLEKLQIVVKYRGDPDMWVRRHDPREHAVMAGEDWNVLLHLFSEVHSWKKGLVTEEYARRIAASFDSLVADDAKELFLANIPWRFD